MIAHIAGSLFIICILSLLKFRPKYERIFSVIFTGAFFIIFYKFLQGWLRHIYNSYKILWDSSPAGDINLEINSSAEIYLIILPFFTITALALLNNLIFRFEIYKKNYISALIFNLFCFIMLIAGNNFIQVITFVFFIDILSQFLIKDIESGRRYALYNLTADMGLFWILAIINGKIENFDIVNIQNYVPAEQHRYFIAVILTISLFIKFGLCLFQNYMTDLKNIRFHRLTLLPFLSSPMAALILAVKASPLLITWPLFHPICNFFVIVTISCGVIGITLSKTLREKTIFLNMMLTALFIRLIEKVNFVWNIHFSWLIVLGFIFNLALYYLYYYTERQSKDCLSTKFYHAAQHTPFSVLGLWIVVMTAFVSQAMAMINYENIRESLVLMIFFALTTAHLFNRIIKHTLPRFDSLSADYSPFLLQILLFLISGYGFFLTQSEWPFALIFICLFALCLIIDPFQYLKSKKNPFPKKLDKSWNKLSYYIKTLSKNILLFAEKFIRYLSVLPKGLYVAGNVSVTGFRKINRSGILRYILLILSGIAIFIACFGGQIIHV